MSAACYGDLRARIGAAEGDTKELRVLRSWVVARHGLRLLTDEERDTLLRVADSAIAAAVARAADPDESQAHRLARSLVAAKDARARGIPWLARVAEERERIEAERAERED